MEYNKRVKTKAAEDFRNRRRNAKHSNADEKLGILNKLLGKKFLGYLAPFSAPCDQIKSEYRSFKQF